MEATVTTPPVAEILTKLRASFDSGRTRGLAWRRGQLRRLRDMGLVKITGRRRAVGRPFTYGTTDKFLELFGLRDLEELPAPEEFQELLEA